MAQSYKRVERVGSVKILPPKSISDQIYEVLRNKILDNEIKPGERLMQEQVAEAFRASRTPIRQAFLLLEKDRLVERIPQGGIRVTEINLDTIREVFGIRGVLESYAVELACSKIERQELGRMREIERQATEILATPTRDRSSKYLRLLELNAEFHETIYNATRSILLAEVINNLRSHVHRYRMISMRKTETWKQVWKEHSQIIGCLESRDIPSACKIMHDHISAAASYVLASF